MNFAAIILAAGKGKRMHSRHPKVLQPLAGRPLLDYVVDAAAAVAPGHVHVVHGFGGEAVQAAMQHRDVHWAHQEEQLGTGHAVEQALPGVDDDRMVVVLYGDVPLIRPETITRLGEQAGADGVALLTVHLHDPAGYGRIVRNDEGRIIAIVEEKDATPDQRAITEVNTGLLAAPAGRLKTWLRTLDNDNAQGEFYLTDVVALAVRDGVDVTAAAAESIDEVSGINDRIQLAAMEEALRRQRAEALMRAGATLADPARVDIRGNVSVGRDVFIDVNVVFEGSVVVGDDVRIGANAVIRNAELAAGTVVEPFSLVEDAVVGEDCTIGPYARLRPGARLASRAKIGNFVEVKKSEIGEGSKVNHLSYVGDATVGAGVNVGAGTITCNYDGVNKHRTVIGDSAFIGSGTMLVAPVEVGANATIGAGSTISRSAPEGQLTVARSRQTSIPSWQRPVKKDTGSRT